MRPPSPIPRPLAACLLLPALAPAAAAHVQLDAPNGGETLVAGETVSVQWHIVIAHNLQNWDLWYSTTGPSGPWIPIATDLPPGSTMAGSTHTFDWTVPNTPSNQVRVRVRMDNSATDYYDVSDGDITIVPGCPSPTTYCVAAPNSSGPGAAIGWSGSASLSAADLVLTVSGASASQPGLFYYGAAQIQAPFGDGFRCVGAGGIGVFRLSPALQSDATGVASRALDYGAPPLASGPGAATPGATWNFQFWYRDPAAGGAGFNLSDALSVTFCP